ncbi:50S ribosomal protein L29 [Candidatus Shapirobacteria bacterium RBG_13_44_7]|uniref:Large ribosomal subunit protein uL29 n=1 Tax=Candidatus Shapirobacteria bacterium RBG_13_44_7 TaxID=1802149 RepID=A0A1F7SIF5_9BACT|nr:MAG: 50S ribosomal protein L29 [Candidatus Shapirobacteria bacterium RBG_13_44_7]
MKKSDKISYQQKDPNELKKLLTDLQKKLVEQRSKFYLGNLKDTSVFKKIKYEIALISTILSTKHEPKSN